MTATRYDTKKTKHADVTATVTTPMLTNAVSGQAVQAPMEYKLQAGCATFTKAALTAEKADLHVGLLATARAASAFTVAQHAPHALHLWRRQTLVQLGLPGMPMRLLLFIPKASQLVQLGDCAGVVVPRGVVMTPGTVGGLLTHVQSNHVMIDSHIQSVRLLVHG